jgi:putative hydrolase
VSNVPFGFGPPSDGDDEGSDPGHGGAGGPINPFAALFGTTDPAELGAAFQRLGQMLSYEGGPVNWELARDVARQTVAATKDRSTGTADQAAVEQAVRLADVWLDAVTVLPAGTTSTAAWSRAEWVEATLPVWKQLVEPLAGRVVGAMSEVVPDEMRAMAGPLLGVMRSLGGAMFGAQVGQALGSLAGEVVASTDVGLPLGPAGKAALLPANIEEFGSGLGIDADQIRLYLALREAAYHRLFGHVPWLRAHLLGAVEGYARGIKVDTGRLESAIGQIDASNPQALQEALSSGMFTPEETPEQKAALSRLETALALVEGWVDAVVDQASARRLPAAGALRETVRRRRASGGPAEQTFATLVGLEMRPRRLRDAATLWALLGERRGAEGRDALWGHPDLLPTAEDLDDPEAFVNRPELDLSALDETAPPEEPGSDQLDLSTPDQTTPPREPGGDQPGGRRDEPGEDPQPGGSV